MGEEGGGIKPEAKLPAVVPSAKPPPAHPKVQGATRGGGEPKPLAAVPSEKPVLRSKPDT